MKNNTENASACYFDVRLDLSEDGATVNVTNSPAGQSSSALPVKLAADRAWPRLDALSAADQIRLGSDLWRSLFLHAETAELWRASAAAGGAYLRLTIGDPALAALPWELLVDPRTARFVALDAQAAVIRFLPLPIASAAPTTDPALRVLFTGCSPAGLPRLNVERERNLLLRALPEQNLTLVGDGLGGTVSHLASQLLHGAVVWHFAGHGAERALIFEDDAGNPVSADAFTVGTLLTGAGVRLAVINACRAGAGGGTVASMAGALLRAGVPAVVAMQAEIADSAAVAFCGSLYQAIALGQSVEQATTSGRRAVFALGETAGGRWWAPVLFARTNAPLTLVNRDAADGDAGATDCGAAANVHASGGSAVSQGGVAISGRVGGNVIVVS